MLPPLVEARLVDLLADRALGTSTDLELQELVALLALHPHLDTWALDIAAAAVDLAALSVNLEPLPAHVAARIERAIATGRSDRTRTATRETPRLRANLVPWTGWMAAAAVLLLVCGWRYLPDRLRASDDRARILAAQAAVTATFAPTSDPAATGAWGDVVWAAQEQKGYLRLQGLARNERAAWQYQLWIFDSERDARYPVDGGVFDVDRERGEVVVPIRVAVRVGKPVAFAVTVERAGGVVVSQRDRVVLLAKM